MSTPTRFASHHGLAELPWFDLRDGRLVLADDTIGPVVDVHTHLALTFGRRQTVDLFAAPGPTEHYLPLDTPLDLEVYANRNFLPADLKRMTHDLGICCLTSRGMRRTHTVPNLVREMRELGFAQSVLLPIDFPVLSWNADAWLDAAARTPELVSMGSVHPLARRAAEKLAVQKQKGALGIKVHPAVQLLPPDHPRCMALYRACGDLGLPVLWHCGPVDIETALGRRCSQLKHYWRAIHEYPGTTFILGHSGALQMEMALTLAKQYPNVWLELSSQSLTNVRRIIAEGPIDRILLGSDWPFYHQSMVLAKVLLATAEGSTERALVLRENAVRLLELDLSACRAPRPAPAAPPPAPASLDN